MLNDLCLAQKKQLELIVILTAFFISLSRGDWIRTSDFTPPRRVL